MEWFRWEAWLAAAFVLGLLEMISMDLILIMLAVGAIAGMITAVARRSCGGPGAGGRGDLRRHAGPGPARA